MLRNAVIPSNRQIRSLFFHVLFKFLPFHNCKSAYVGIAVETARKGRCCFADDIQRPILWWHAVSTSTCNIGMLFTHVKGPVFLAQTFIFTDSPMHLLKWEMRCLQKNVFLHFLLNLNFQLNFIHANNLCLNVKIDCCCLSYRSSTCRRWV